MKVSYKTHERLLLDEMEFLFKDFNSYQKGSQNEEAVNQLTSRRKRKEEDEEK